VRERERERECMCVTENERQRDNEEQQYHLLYTTSTTNHHPRTRSRASTDNRHAQPTVATRLTRRDPSPHVCSFAVITPPCDAPANRPASPSTRGSTRPSHLSPRDSTKRTRLIRKMRLFEMRLSAFSLGKFLEEWTGF